MATDPEGARSMGNAGARRVREMFAIAACADRYDALYRGLLAGRSAESLAPVENPQAPARP